MRINQKLVSCGIASLAIVLSTMLAAAAPSKDGRSFAMSHQFHLQPKPGQSKFADRMAAELADLNGKRGAARPDSAQAQRGVKPHRNGGPVSGAAGFVSAAQIAAGGDVASNAAVEGDFNGDGKPDLLTMVVNQSGGSYAISASVALGNGDGTFQAPVLTAIPSNTVDAFVVGDVNGDGKTDLVVVHQPGSLGSGTPASLDVMLANGDGTFGTPINTVVTANALAGGILYDVGNGKMDAVIVDSSTPGNVWTLLGNGDGTFGTPTSVVLSGPVGSAVVFADFNGDGKLDFADDDPSTGELTVFLANGTGYAAGVLVSTPDGVYDGDGNAVGDMNGDGFPEIVSANPQANTITVYVNNGSGGFAPGVYYQTAMAGGSGKAWTVPSAVSLGDVNGDGKADVVVTNDYSGDLTVMLGNGDGTVQVPTVGYAAGGFAFTAAVIDDFNGDGLPDLAVTDGQYNLVYMKGYGDGTFRAAADFYTATGDTAETQGLDIATGDFNGDGIPDVVIGNALNDPTVGITVFLSRGDGTLMPGVNYGSGGQMGYVAVGDFNQDGKLDIAAADNTNGDVQIFYGDGQGGFQPGPTIPTGNTGQVVALDVNGDGYPDIVAAEGSGAGFEVALNNGAAGGFGSPVSYTYNNPAQTTLAAADVNGDGAIDVVAPVPSCSCVAVLLGNVSSTTGKGDGTFGAETDYPIGTGPTYVAIGDLNGDGFPDLAVTIDDTSVTGTMGIVVALNNGAAGSSTNVFGAPSAVYPTSLQSTIFYLPFPHYVKIGDINGDGVPDLVYTNLSYGTIGTLYGNGDGTFGSPTEFPTASYSPAVALADVNNDGALDAVTVTEDGTSLATVLLNASGSGEAPNYNVAANPSSATVSAGGTGSYVITLTPRNFYNGTVTFSCGTLPAETTCNFSNTTLTPNGNPPMTTTVSLVTTAASSAANALHDSDPHRGARFVLASLSGMGFFGLVLAGLAKKEGLKKSNRRVAMLLGVMVLGVMFSTVGCGGGNTQLIVTPPPNQGTPAGTYTVTVTASGTAGTNNGNTSAHTVTLTLTVQ